MKKIVWLIALLVLLVGCGDKTTTTAQEEPKNSANENNRSKVDDDKAKEEKSNQEKNKVDADVKKPDEKTDAPEKIMTKDDIDLSLQPNEGGKVMVLMYHGIDTPEDEWVRTPENFRNDLQNLYDRGYLPIRLIDYVNGNITTPAGKTPYVLTFDDTNENNFKYLANGEIDPDCAVGVLLDFAKTHEDFEPHAIFFGNGEIPFRNTGQESKKVNFLIENKMDVGNHTVNHPDFTTYDSAEDIQFEVGHQAQYLESLFDQDYEINTLALPFGSRPDDEALETYLESGTYNGKAYENLAILNVGWDPYYSPYHVEFNPLAIHRVRASETNVDEVGIYNWLDFFDANPQSRFISDGVADVITAPEDFRDVIEERSDKELYFY